MEIQQDSQDNWDQHIGSNKFFIFLSMWIAIFPSAGNPAVFSLSLIQLGKNQPSKQPTNPTTQKPNNIRADYSIVSSLAEKES